MKEKLEKTGELFLKKFLETKGCLVHLIENKAGGRGVPDMLCIKDGFALLFELKKESTLKDLRPAQKRTLLTYNGCSLAYCDNGNVKEYYPHNDSVKTYINTEEWYLTLNNNKWSKQ